MPKCDILVIKILIKENDCGCLYFNENKWMTQIQNSIIEYNGFHSILVQQ
jgi:hypothetical protein